MYRDSKYYALLGYFHVHQQARCYPTLADPVNLVSGSASAWDVGTITEIIPADTITNKFDIHFLEISDISATDNYELVLYGGASGSEEEIARVRFSQEGPRPIQIPIQDPNTRISAALACADGDGATCDVSVYYHTYPAGV